MSFPFDRIPNRERGTPDAPGTFEFICHSHDGVPIAGWGWANAIREQKKEPPCGTLFFLHGFSSNCGNAAMWKEAFDLAGCLNLALVSHDSRHHGRSGDRNPTF